MADRRKALGIVADGNQETDRQFMDKNNVNGMLKDVLTKLIANRPDDPIRFIANYFETINLEDQSNDLIARVVQIINLTHHSRPVFETNIMAAYDLLNNHKISKKIHGVNGTVHSQLLQSLCTEIPLPVTVKLFKKIGCAEHEAVPYDVFRSTVFTCCVLKDYVGMTGNLFNILDVRKTGKVDKVLCESTLEQLNTALASSQKDVKRIMESSYHLGPESLFKALDKALSKSHTKLSGVFTRDQFVIEACECFLAKVKKLK
ncbi:tubulin polyglutamylase complex subunit 1-like [Physella acuta]|uniref:tubulin polyglutamylase complex subunit 1-like n=1 Tax=Physella acuta TaxID=109671 RepID=UPI0027DE3A0C|nr:tubulin polyglutamylase complex subunit 1-like [Physella acuta]